MKKTLTTFLAILSLSLFLRVAAQFPYPVLLVEDYAKFGADSSYYIHVTGNARDIVAYSTVEIVTKEGGRYSFGVRGVVSTPSKGEGYYSIFCRPQADMSTLEMTGKDMFLVKRGGLYPTEGRDSRPPSEESGALNKVTARFNDDLWNAKEYERPSLYYEGGNLMIESSGKPVMVLIFRAADEPDKRFMAITISGFSGQPGKDFAKTTAMITGNSDGTAAGEVLYIYTPDYLTEADEDEFNFEVTGYEPVSGEKALVSGTFSGIILSPLDDGKLVISDGRFEKMEVTVVKK